MRAALDTERQRGFLEASKRLRRPEAEAYMPGGYFRQFLTKYPELNLLYSRLLYTHLLVNQMRGDKSRKKSALQELWRGQHGAAYWHGDGPGGGIFDSRLRLGSYRAFIEAEKIARSGQSFLPSIIPTDFDMDGEPEYLYQGRTFNAMVEPRGAGLAELDFLPCSWNYLGTMARWPQPYHRFKYEGCDWYLRQAFLDHFFGAETQIESFDRMSYAEQGDFLNQPFALVHLRREHEDIGLSRTGRLRVRRRDHPFSVQKRYRFKEAAVECSVQLRNDSAVELELWYGLELNLALASRGEAHLLALKGSQKKELGTERTEADKLDGVQVRDPANEVTIGLESSSPFSLWSLPVETVSYPPSGRLRQYQSSCLVLSWKFPLAAGEQWEGKVTLRLETE
jgi:alpha-amylase